MAASPRVSRVTVKVRPGETIYRTACSDLHCEASRFPHDEFEQFAQERNALKNHKWLLLGDVMDLITPGDRKRYRPGLFADKDKAEIDAYFDDRMEYAENFMDQYGLTGNVELLTMGNHELAFLKYHGTDPVHQLARHTGAIKGGYSGVHQIRIVPVSAEGKDLNNARVVTLCYHHGAWGGVIAKGIAGAERFFGQYQGWHFALYGHNHWSRIDPQQWFRVNKIGDLVKSTRYLVCCGHWQEMMHLDSQQVSWPETRGFPSGPALSPLLKIQLKNYGAGSHRSAGQKKGFRLKLSVEI